MYIHLSLQEEIVHNNFLMGVKFWTSWRNFQEFLKSNYYGDFFQKLSPTCDFLKKVKGFPYKIEGDFF